MQKHIVIKNKLEVFESVRGSRYDKYDSKNLMEMIQAKREPCDEPEKER